jgi:tetratricopeptide (TPR) repeat protein
VERAVLATASELYGRRHYPGVITLVSDALVHDPENIVLLLLRARSRMALRSDVEAQADLREVIRIDPRCSLAYRLLGVLAARRDENESAAILFAEALRLDPEDIEADTWLAILDTSRRTPRFAIGTVDGSGDGDSDDDRTSVMVAGPEPDACKPQVVARHAGVFRAYPVRELPGFGEYLVESGILTRERLRAAQAYQRSMKVQLSAAIVALGLATPQRIELAAIAHQKAVQ